MNKEEFIKKFIDDEFNIPIFAITCLFNKLRKSDYTYSNSEIINDTIYIKLLNKTQDTTNEYTIYKDLSVFVDMTNKYFNYLNGESLIIKFTTEEIFFNIYSKFSENSKPNKMKILKGYKSDSSLEELIVNEIQIGSNGTDGTIDIISNNDPYSNLNESNFLYKFKDLYSSNTKFIRLGKQNKYGIIEFKNIANIYRDEHGNITFVDEIADNILFSKNIY